MSVYSKTSLSITGSPLKDLGKEGEEEGMGGGVTDGLTSVEASIEASRGEKLVGMVDFLTMPKKCKAL